MTAKQSLDTWEAHKKAIMSSTTIDEKEHALTRAKRIKKLEADPEQWFQYYFPEYYSASPASFHLEATKRMLQNKEHYEVRMWSRELAKSTRTMMEVLYLTLVGHQPDVGDLKGGIEQRLKKRYVLLISNSLDNATRLLMPFKANFEFNKRIIQDYGIQENPGKWQASEFVTTQGVAFRALGVGQSPRGTRNEEARPDILLFDDVDTDADCLNPDIVAKKWRWIEEAAIGTRSVSQPTTILFCGNRIAVDCCIERARCFADEVSLINIRDEEGLSSWPAKNTQTDIDRVLSQKSYAATQKEYFNNPVTEGAVFKEMAYKPALPVAQYSDLICYTDPSYKAGADYKATVLVGKWQNEYHIIKCFLEQCTSATMIDWHFNIHQLTRPSRCTFYMEEVFLQDVIRKELNDACMNRKIPLNVRGDTRSKPDKFTRIETLLEPLNRNGRLYLAEQERYNPHMLRLEEQFLALTAGSHAHDDGPDAVEGAIWLLGERAAVSNDYTITPIGRLSRQPDY